MRVAINGFGRIGRTVFRILRSRGVNVVAINDVHGADDADYLLQYDTVYGRYPGLVELRDRKLYVDGKVIEVLSERDPAELPWKKLKVDVVVEATGVFRDREGASKHLEAGASYVLITAPSKGEDYMVVPGVNHKGLKKSHKIISVASCTTNCLAPVASVLEQKFGIVEGLMTTVHAYTNDQVLQDQFHKKRRRGRGGAANMIPTSTGAAEAVTKVIPSLKGKLTGVAVRVPVPVGSLVDLTVRLKRKVGVAEVNGALKKASEGSLYGILGYTEDEIVSSDVVGQLVSSLVDGKSTMQVRGLVKVLSWYDNEFGYSSRVADVAEMVGGWC